MCSRVAAKRAGLLASALVLLTALAPTDLWPQQAGRQKDLTQEEIQTLRAEIAELQGRAIIGFKPADARQGMRPDGTPALTTSAVSRLAESLEPLGVVVWRQFRIIPAVAVRMDPDRLEELLANPDIDYVEPDYLHEPTAQTTPWGINRVNAPAAWAFTKGSGASVGIMDTGIDEDHPDLNPIGGKNFVTGGTTRSDWDDNSAYCSTHGTHVAGTVAALDNTTGVVGVAPEADLYALRVFDPEGEGITYCSAFLSAIIPAIEWAATNGLDVINMSFSSWSPSFAEADALFAAYSAGVLPVAAAGNDNLDGQVLFPAAFPHVIAVAAIDAADNVASFSNAGPDIELAAPGVNVASTYGGGGTATSSGTSMASPHVAGAATLVRALRPDLSVDEVRQVLRSTADDIGPAGFDWASGYGVVDAGAAVAAVAPANLVLFLDPGELTLAAEPGGASITTPVDVHNIGAAGEINWTATDNATWITLSPTSGSASDVTPGLLNVTANPAGLGNGFHTGFVTVSGNAANSPVTMRVRLAVAPRITLDPALTTAGMLPVGNRVRYLVAGSAGQEIDVAVLTDYTASQRLYDPVVRVYMPDGETMLAWSDMAPWAGLGYQALVYKVYLPETGDYVVEVGSWADASGGGFLLKARQAGPILGFSPYTVSQRGEQNGANASTSFWVYNLSGLGTLDWTGTPSQDWMTISPGSGTASQTGKLVRFDDYSMPEIPREEAQSEVTGADPHVAGAPDRALLRGLLGSADYEVPDERLAEAHRDWLQAAARGAVDPPRLSREVQATVVTVDLDPTGLPLKLNYGSIYFQPDDGWLSNQQVTVTFFVYSQGMDIASSGHLNAYETATDDTRPGDPPVMVGTGDDGGSLFAVPRVGPLGTPLATDVYYPGGLATDHDANWLMYDRLATGHYIIWKFLRDGSRSVFVEDPTLPGPVFWLTWGPDENLFGSTGCWVGGQVYDIAGDGSSVTPVSSSLPSCVGGVAYRPQDNSLYIANLLDYGLTKLSLDDGSTSTLATGVYLPMAVAVGNSGVVYFTDDYGDVWSIDPDVTTTATQIGVTPGRYDLYGIDLVDGNLVISNRYYGEFYRYPIDDGPIPHPDGDGHYVAYLDLEQIDAVQGEPFSVPLVVESGDGSNLPVAAYQCQLGWQPQELDYLENQEGDFGGTYVPNGNDAGQGVFLATAARATNVNVPSTELFSMVWDFLLEPGSCTDVVVEFGELSSEIGEDLLPLLEVVSPVSIGLTEGMGDVTGDGNIGAADAVQILRFLVGLPICTGCDISRGDANCDGVIQAADAVVILRWLVGLPVGDACVGIPRIGPCPQ